MITTEEGGHAGGRESGSERVNARRLGSLTSVSAQISGANAPFQGEWRVSPTLNQSDAAERLGTRGVASPLNWVVSAKQPYHFSIRR